MTIENKPSARQMIWTPERKAAHGELTRARMAPADVRRRISERTREALAGRAERTREAFTRRVKLEILRAAWAATDTRTRSEFFAEIEMEMMT